VSHLRGAGICSLLTLAIGSRKPTEITLVRARIFYARPVRSKRRSIVLGFPAARQSLVA
jgi:hypothetical protein